MSDSKLTPAGSEKPLPTPLQKPLSWPASSTLRFLRAPLPFAMSCSRTSRSRAAEGCSDARSHHRTLRPGVGLGKLSTRTVGSAPLSAAGVVATAAPVSNESILIGSGVAAGAEPPSLGPEAAERCRLRAVSSQPAAAAPAAATASMSDATSSSRAEAEGACARREVGQEMGSETHPLPSGGAAPPAEEEERQGPAAAALEAGAPAVEEAPQLPPKTKRPRAPKPSVHEAAAAAHADARDKLDALIERPCREGSSDAIAACRRAATLMAKEQEEKLKTLVKEQIVAAKAKEAAKRKAAAAKLKLATERAKKRALAATKKRVRAKRPGEASMALSIVDSEDEASSREPGMASEKDKLCPT